jgi:hypothetical protein
MFLIKFPLAYLTIYLQEKGIPAISRPDRKDLLAYLTGQTNTNDRVDRNAPLEITMQRPLQGER